MATQLGIYKGAALILREGATTLTVSDTSVLVNTFNVEWTKARNTVLENGKWNFAARSLSIEADTDNEPEFGYSYAFAKPSDYRNLIALAASATFYPPFGPNQYRDEGAFWFANCDPLYASVVSDGASYGGDLSKWPEVVARAAEYELAFRAGPHVTSMNEQALEQLERRKLRALQRAKSWDAGKQPPDPLPPSRLSTARGSGRRASWRDY